MMTYEKRIKTRRIEDISTRRTLPILWTLYPSCGVYYLDVPLDYGMEATTSYHTNDEGGVSPQRIHIHMMCTQVSRL